MEEMNNELNNLQLKPMLDDGDLTIAPKLPDNPEMGIPTGGICEPEVGDFLSEEEFYAGFKQVFQFAGEWTNTESLPIKQNEEPGARKTSEKLYQMAKKYRFLNFLVSKQSTWLADAALIGVFVYGKANAVIEEKTKLSITNMIFGKLKWKQKELGFLARLGLVKQQKPENSSEVAGA